MVVQVVSLLAMILMAQVEIMIAGCMRKRN